MSSATFFGSTRISVEKACDALDVIPSVARNLFELPQESRFLSLRLRNDKRAFLTLIRDEPFFLAVSPETYPGGIYWISRLMKIPKATCY